MRLILSILFPCLLAAQPWAGIISTDRAKDWSNPGATITNRTTRCGSVVAAYTGTGATIQTAIDNCTSGQYVELGAGTFNLSTGFNLKSNITIRGQGANSTFLVFTGKASACSGSICSTNNAGNWVGAPGNVVDWTAGYSVGTTQITVSATTNMTTGTVLILDQENDSNTDPGGLWICGRGGLGYCCVTCSDGASRPGPPGRNQQQVVKVAAIDGTTVTLTDPIFMPGWTAGKNPQAWYPTAAHVVNVGIENMSLNHTSNGTSAGIVFTNSYNSWVKGIRSIYSNRAHVQVVQGARVTVRDSYFYGTLNASSQSYGVEHFITSHNLVENNIFEHVAAPQMINNGSGSVWAYNYVMDDYYSEGGGVAAMAGAWDHGGGIMYQLWEGNVMSIGLRGDYIHGLSHFETAFRNRFAGYESDAKTQMSTPIMIQMGHRFWNVIGNVLGTTGKHVAYTVSPPGSSTNCHYSIYALGWGGYCASGSLADDATVATSMMRWGNYDTYNAAVRWEASEIPTANAYYPVSVPASQSLPNSFYLGSRPNSWWRTPYGTPAWPPIGPDVTGGDITGVGGHANKIPAQLCRENAALDGGNAWRVFDSATCYLSDVREKHLGGKTSIPAGSIR